MRRSGDKPKKELRGNHVSEPAPCLLCPFGDASVMREEHHVVGRNNDSDLTAGLCTPDHREQHEQLRESGASMRIADNRLDWMISVLRALGTFLHGLAEACFRWVEVLCGLRDDLDRYCPTWRQIPKRK
jgi:hypothetical protein